VINEYKTKFMKINGSVTSLEQEVAWNGIVRLLGDYL
jgi:hypothetical protein